MKSFCVCGLLSRGDSVDFVNDGHYVWVNKKRRRRWLSLRGWETSLTSATSKSYSVSHQNLSWSDLKKNSFIDTIKSSPQTLSNLVKNRRWFLFLAAKKRLKGSQKLVLNGVWRFFLWHDEIDTTISSQLPSDQSWGPINVKYSWCGPQSSRRWSQDCFCAMVMRWIIEMIPIGDLSSIVAIQSFKSSPNSS